MTNAHETMSTSKWWRYGRPQNSAHRSDLQPCHQHALGRQRHGEPRGARRDIGDMESRRYVPEAGVVPLALFLGGLICLCVGTLLTLLRESPAIREMQSATSLLDLPMRVLQGQPGPG